MSYKTRSVQAIVPAKLLFQAPAKINLALRVRGRRESDGYHILEMENVSVTLADIVEMEVAPQPNTTVSIVLKDSTIQLSAEHREILSSNANIAVRAAYLFSESFKVTFALKIMLTKKIPIGSGLAGGSADGAAVLRGLAHLFGIEVDALLPLAVQLGADLPYCLYRMPAAVSGVGECITPLSLNIGSRILICVPAVSLSTQAVFAEFDRLGASGAGSNDLLAPAVSLVPQLAELHKIVSGIPGVSGMTGSGSAFFVVPSDQNFDTAPFLAVQPRIAFDLFDERIILN